MSFGGANQKFPMSGIGFENQQGMGSSPGGLMNSEMVTYPTLGRSVVNVVHVWLSSWWERLPAAFKHEGRQAEQDGRIRVVSFTAVFGRFAGC